jgi:hypothetical protein
VLGFGRVGRCFGVEFGGWVCLVWGRGWTVGRMYIVFGVGLIGRGKLVWRVRWEGERVGRVSIVLLVGGVGFEVGD